MHVNLPLDFPAFFRLFRMTCAHFDEFRVFFAAVDCFMTRGSGKMALAAAIFFERI